MFYILFDANLVKYFFKELHFNIFILEYKKYIRLELYNLIKYIYSNIKLIKNS